MKEFARNSGENGREVRNQAKLITYLPGAACELPGAFLGSAKLFRVSPRSIPKPRPAVRRVKCIPPALLPSACGNRGP